MFSTYLRCVPIRAADGNGRGVNSRKFYGNIELFDDVVYLEALTARLNTHIFYNTVMTAHSLIVKKLNIVVIFRSLCHTHRVLWTQGIDRVLRIEIGHDTLQWSLTCQPRDAHDVPTNPRPYIVRTLQPMALILKGDVIITMMSFGWCTECRPLTKFLKVIQIFGGKNKKKSFNPQMRFSVQRPCLTAHLVSKYKIIFLVF